MPTAIVGYNASDGSEDALAFGCLLRRALDYQLIVVSCAVDPFERLGGHYVEILRKDAEDALSSARLAVEDDRGVQFRIARGKSAGHALHDFAVRHEAELIVLGATHRRASADLFTPSITHQTIQGAPCAVAVPPAGFRDHPRPRLTHLAVAFDDSPESYDALLRAAAVARETGAQIRVLHSFHPVSASVPFAAISYADHDFLAETRSLAEDRLAHATARLAEEAPGVEVSTRLLTGDAAERLIEASERADLLFLGSRGYGPLKRALLGSVSGRVVRSARCPVIVTPRTAAHSAREHVPGDAHIVAA